jgi:hypothetical protein
MIKPDDKPAQARPKLQMQVFLVMASSIAISSSSSSAFDYYESTTLLWSDREQHFRRRNQRIRSAAGQELVLSLSGK